METKNSIVSVLNPDDFSYLTVCNNNLNRFLSDPANRSILQQAFVKRYQNTKLTYTTLQAQHEMYLLSLKFASKIYNSVKPVYAVDGNYYQKQFDAAKNDTNKKIEISKIFVSELQTAAYHNFKNFFAVYESSAELKTDEKISKNIAMLKNTYSSLVADIENANTAKDANINKK